MYNAAMTLTSARLRILAVSSLMLLSGFAGIAYEVLYGRILGNIIGDQFAVSAAVLITFLLGIGIGSVQAHRLWRHLWLIELGIGLFALLFALNSGALDAFLYDHLPQVFGGLGWAIAVSVTLLAIPAFLIGCSLPLFAGYLAQAVDRHAFSRAYTLYNFGAALTIIAIEFYLLRQFGLQHTVSLIAAINALIAFGVLFWSRRLRHAPDDMLPAVALSVPRREIVALVLAGMASAIFQLFMVKFAELFLGPFRETFALVLSIVLLGIAVGAWLVTRFGWRFERVLLGCLAGLALMLLSVDWVTGSYARLYEDYNSGYWSGVALKWLALAAVMGLPAVCFGATIPAMITGRGHVTRESGYLLYLAALGNVAGFLLMAFVLHQQLDYGVQLLVACGLVLAAMALYRPLALRRVATLGLLGVVVVSAHAMAWDEDLLFISYTKFRDPDKLRSTRANLQLPEKYKGRQDVFSINRVNGRPYFFINGYVSIPLNNPSERIVGALSSMYAPRLDEALVLGLGSGATASTVGQLFDHTDVVEINPVVRDNLFRMKQWNFDIEANPRVNIVVDDAIHYTKASDKQYSLILNTVTTPLYFSSSKLYTHEFFEVIRQRLAPGGIYVTWIDSRIGDKGVDIILSSLRQSFNQCGTAYIKSTYLLMLCGQERLRYLPEAVTRMPAEVSGYFWEEGIDPAMIRYQLLTTETLALIGDTEVPLNRLDYPSLEFEMARLSEKGIHGFKRRLRARMNPLDIAAVMGPGHFSATDLLLHAELRLKDNSFTRRWRKLIERGDDAYWDAYGDSGDRFYREYLKHTDSIRARYRYATFLRKTERYRQAILYYQQVLRRDPDYNNANYYRALCHERLEEYPLATEYFRRELVADPDDRDAHYRMGRVAYKQGRYREAIAQMEKAVARKANASRYFYLAKAYERAGDKAGARRAYQEALRRQPDDGLGIREALSRL